MIGGIFSRKGFADGWTALRFVNPRGVQLVQVTGLTTGGRPVVSRCEYVLLDGDGRSLERVRKEAKLKRWRCTMLLEPGEYQMLMVEAPNVPAAELKSALRWRVKDLLDYPVEEATLDVLEIPAPGAAAGRGKMVYAIVARSSLLKERMARLVSAKVPLRVIDIPEMAQRNLANLYEPASGVALLAFDGSGGLLTVTHGGELYLARRIEVTLSQLQDVDEAAAREHFERVTLELQRSLDHVDRQFHFIALAKLVIGPLPETVGLREHLAASLGIAVESMNLAALLDLEAVPELLDAGEQCGYFHALGAALREEARPS